MINEQFGLDNTPTINTNGFGFKFNDYCPEADHCQIHYLIRLFFQQYNVCTEAKFFLNICNNVHLFQISIVSTDNIVEQCENLELPIV